MCLIIAQEIMPMANVVGKPLKKKITSVTKVLIELKGPGKRRMIKFKALPVVKIIGIPNLMYVKGWTLTWSLFSIFKTTSGKLYSSGWGADGQLGQGHYDSNDTIERVIGDVEHENITKVVSSADCVLALNGERTHCKETKFL